MADEEEQLLLLDSGIFNIGSPGSGEEDNNNNNEQQQQGGGKHNNDTIYITPEEKKKNRTGQTEEQFQAVRRSYRAKVENGEVWWCTQYVVNRIHTNRRGGGETDLEIHDTTAAPRCR